MTERSASRFDPRYRAVAAGFGVSPDRAFVEVTDDVLDARDGPWRVRTPLANVVGVERSGPSAEPETIGPAHLSLRNRELTFASNPDAGL